MPSASYYRIGLLVSFAAVLAWSSAGFFTRLIPHDSYTILFWRGLFGSIGIAALMRIRFGRGWLGEFRKFGRLEAAYALITTFGMVSFIVSLNMTSVAHNSVIYATIPFMSAALGWLWLREKPAGSAIAASLAALAGVIIMMSKGGDGDFWGDVLSFVMTFSMSFSILLARKYPELATMPAVIAGALLGSIICAPIGDPLNVSWLDLGYLLAFGLISTALGNLFFAIGSRRIPAIESALIGALDAPLAPLWVWLAFSETPSLVTIIGGGIVFAAVVLHILFSASRQPAPPPPV